ncbi:hypothetical protein BSU04_05065 [Caballeronia sordidicola]|uniref:Uncharacterized protein n=1 Tax=Caballeronia sordidicola TaxID=196367 RepID=A0A226X8W7_CABSO|nr:hypothetical protein BSU04_05065 [Caballeronia sordidicola]
MPSEDLIRSNFRVADDICASVFCAVNCVARETRRSFEDGTSAREDLLTALYESPRERRCGEQELARELLGERGYMLCNSGACHGGDTSVERCEEIHQLLAVHQLAKPSFALREPTLNEEVMLAQLDLNQREDYFDSRQKRKVVASSNLLQGRVHLFGRVHEKMEAFAGTSRDSSAARVTPGPIVWASTSFPARFRPRYEAVDNEETTSQCIFCRERSRIPREFQPEAVDDGRERQRPELAVHMNIANFPNLIEELFQRQAVAAVQLLVCFVDHRIAMCDTPETKPDFDVLRCKHRWSKTYLDNRIEFFLRPCRIRCGLPGNFQQVCGQPLVGSRHQFVFRLKVMVDQAARYLGFGTDPVNRSFGKAVTSNASHGRVDDRSLAHGRQFSNTPSVCRGQFLLGGFSHFITFRSRYAADYMRVQKDCSINCLTASLRYPKCTLEAISGAA